MKRTLLALLLIAAPALADSPLSKFTTFEAYPDEGSPTAYFVLRDTAGNAVFSVNKTSGAITMSGVVSSMIHGTSGAANSVGGAANSIVAEGATADGSEGTLAFGDFSGDRTWTFGAAGDLLMTGTPTADPSTASRVAYGSGIVFEGTTADGFEGTLVFGDASADYSWSFLAGGSFGVSGATLADPATVSTASYGNNGFTVEGAADGFEASFTVSDPTADNSLVWGAAGTLTSSAAYLATGAGTADPTTASVGSYGGTSMVFEGSTSDGFETTVAVTDPTADNTLTVTATGGLTSNGTGTFGWAVVDGADNTACSSICTTPAVFGFDGTTPVGPSDAAADICLCAGAN